ALPVLLVVVDEDGHVRPCARVLDPAQAPRPLRLLVDRGIERLAVEDEHDRDEMRPSVRVDRREPRHARLRQYSRLVHLGVTLPTFGAGSSPDGIRRVADAAEELGFDSVWTTEHIVVGPEGVNPYGRVYDPFVTLGWISGWTERIGLGTSIVLLPLHSPFHVAKEVATLPDISPGRLTLGVGMGWHRDEFEFMDRPVAGRGPRGGAE